MANTIPGVGVAAPGTPTPVAPVHSPTAAPVRPAPAVAPVVPAGAVVHAPNQPRQPSGNALPVSGAHSPPPPEALNQLSAVVQGINQFLRANQREFVYEVDAKSGKATVTIVNPATGEIVRQIPAERVVSSAVNLQQEGLPVAGLMLDEKA